MTAAEGDAGAAVDRATAELAVNELLRLQQEIVDDINEFARTTLVARGGRMGSGLGTLLEGLWGFYSNKVLAEQSEAGSSVEVAWITDNQYNDFAVVQRSLPWDPITKAGELFRIEAKSMNQDAEESKGHFDELATRIGEWDRLLVLLWRWVPVDEWRVVPQIQHWFLGQALGVARLRDRLHVARRGSFVDRIDCPDGCDPTLCAHHGEPLNAAGLRERRSGPESTQRGRVAYAANFGGLIRMMKTRSDAARAELADEIGENSTAAAYAEFIVDAARDAPAIIEDLTLDVLADPV